MKCCPEERPPCSPGRQCTADTLHLTDGQWRGWCSDWSTISTTLWQWITPNHNVPDHTITFLEAVNARADLIDLTGNITAEDGGPLLDEDAVVLLVAVQRIDGDGGVLENYFVGSGWGKGSWVDYERFARFFEPGCLVGWLRHDVLEWVEMGCGLV
jgi:hypothetical protein